MPRSDVLRQPGQQNTQSVHRADSAIWRLNGGAPAPITLRSKFRLPLYVQSPLIGAAIRQCRLACPIAGCPGVPSPQGQRVKPGIVRCQAAGFESLWAATRPAARFLAHNNDQHLTGACFARFIPPGPAAGGSSAAQPDAYSRQPGHKAKRHWVIGALSRVPRVRARGTRRCVRSLMSLAFCDSVSVLLLLEEPEQAGRDVRDVRREAG